MVSEILLLMIPGCSLNVAFSEPLRSRTFGTVECYRSFRGCCKGLTLILKLRSWDYVRFVVGGFRRLWGSEVVMWALCGLVKRGVGETDAPPAVLGLLLWRNAHLGSSTFLQGPHPPGDAPITVNANTLIQTPNLSNTGNVEGGSRGGSPCRGPGGLGFRGHCGRRCGHRGGRCPLSQRKMSCCNMHSNSTRPHLR